VAAVFKFLQEKAAELDARAAPPPPLPPPPPPR
jgi:hypothetical protein